MSDVEWRPKDFPNYEVSSGGRVRSLPRERTRGGILKPVGNSQGYLSVALCRGRETKRVRIHKLVAEAFLGPCPPGQEVRHLDDDKGNNRSENLAYGTHRENAEDALRNGSWTREPRPKAPRKRADGPRPHCRRNHPWTPENTHIGPDGRRRCRACVGLRYQQRQERRTAA